MGFLFKIHCKQPLTSNHLDRYMKRFHAPSYKNVRNIPINSIQKLSFLL